MNHLSGDNFVLRDKILSFSFRKPFNFISKNTPFVPTSLGQGRQIKSFSFATAEGGRGEITSLFKNSGLNQNWLPELDSNQQPSCYKYSPRFYITL